MTRLEWGYLEKLKRIDKMVHGPKIINHDVFIGTNISFLAKFKKSDDTIIIETNDITAIQFLAYGANDNMATATPLLTRTLLANSSDFTIDNTNKQIVFDIVFDSQPIGFYVYQIIITKTSWSEPKAIYAGKIKKHANAN